MANWGGQARPRQSPCRVRRTRQYEGAAEKGVESPVKPGLQMEIQPWWRGTDFGGSSENQPVWEGLSKGGAWGGEEQRAAWTAEDKSEFQVDRTSVRPARGLVVQGQHQADNTQSVHAGAGWGTSCYALEFQLLVSQVRGKPVRQGFFPVHCQSGQWGQIIWMGQEQETRWERWNHTTKIWPQDDKEGLTWEDFRDRADHWDKACGRTDFQPGRQGWWRNQGPGGAWTFTASEQCPCLEQDPLRHPWVFGVHRGSEEASRSSLE